MWSQLSPLARFPLPTWLQAWFLSARFTIWDSESWTVHLRPYQRSEASGDQNPGFPFPGPLPARGSMAVGRHHKCILLFVTDWFVRLHLPSPRGSEVAASEVSGLVFAFTIFSCLEGGQMVWAIAAKLELSQAAAQGQGWGRCQGPGAKLDRPY